MSNMVPNVDMMVPNGGAAGGGGTSLVVGLTPITGGTNGYMLYDNGGKLGEQPIALTVATGNVTVYVAKYTNTIIGGSGGANGTYGTVAMPIAMTGGSGTGATAIIVVSGGAVTGVVWASPGTGYIVGDTLSAASGSIGGTTGFSTMITAIGNDANLGTVGSPFATIGKAFSVVSGFDFLSLYYPVIHCADAVYHYTAPLLFPEIFDAVLTPHGAKADLIGNLTSPTNCKLAPNDGSGNYILEVIGVNWCVTGFSFYSDATASGGFGSNPVRAANGGILILGNVDWDGNTANWNFALASANQGGEIYDGTDNINGGANWSVSGLTNCEYWTSSPPSFFQIQNPTVITFNSVNNIGGNPVFTCANGAQMDLGFLTNGGSFVNPGNITGGPPIVSQGQIALGVDPSTITWPGGPFDPSQVASGAGIDGFYYALRTTGVPQATDSYKNSWRFIKDTQGKGQYLSYNDNGMQINLSLAAGALSAIHASLGGI
jgi:hypothetical protein